FPFLPLDSIWWDVRMYGYQPFWHRLYNPGTSVRRVMPYGVGALLLGLLLVSIRRPQAPPVPWSLWAFFISVVLVYGLSRILAFKLYVPNRHLQFPMSFFLIVAVSGAVWRLFCTVERPRFCARPLATAIGYALLMGVVVLGTADGLQGTANFNYSLFKKGKVFAWLRENTPERSLIAGHPTHIDALPLFAKRRAFVTTETTHPFYPTYYQEMKRRQIISLKAHYARDLQEIVSLLEPEGIDYFVFSRQRFYPDKLKSERYYAPLNILVDELTSYPADSYAYKQIPRELDLDKAPYQIFRDDQSAVIDIAKLKRFLEGAS
ncbi:MAG: hypothetical protein KDD62_08590, partial [Bdellovibrionales bacterium]|nr:hypothetical protein [Bdellovibrionales bacterium]